jgi:Transposase, Mutator family
MHTMALDQSALLEVLEVLKAAEVDDRIPQAAETIYQALIEAELTSVIGAWHQRTETRTAQRNGHRLPMPDDSVDVIVCAGPGPRAAPLSKMDLSSTIATNTRAQAPAAPHASG